MRSLTLFLFFALLLTEGGPAPAQTPPVRPDAKMTPGATLPVTVADLSVPGYTKRVRNVPQGVKDRVYAAYHIIRRAPGEYEVDHLISLELGGSNSVKNLWPESYVTQPWNAHVKDRLENKLHRMIVAGRITLPEAQREIATDWIAAYRKYFGPGLPVSKRRQIASASHKARHIAATSAAAKGAAGQVWVNLNTGVYHFPGQRWYGNTANGQFMSEAAARKAGYRGTENGQ